jgi:hemolysin activation/secretion protein
MTLFPSLSRAIIFSVIAIAVCPLQAIAEIPSTKIDSIQKVLAESGKAEVANPNQPINEINPSSEISVEKDLPSHDICPLAVDLTEKAAQIIPLTQVTVDDQTITLQIQGTMVLDRLMILSDPKISEILKQSQEKKLTKAEFITIYQEITKSLTQMYLNQGYITSKAVPQENLEIPVDGVITIPILEGRLKEIVLIGRGRLNPNYLCDRVGLGIGVPLNIIQVEEQLRLLRQNPLLSGIDGNLKNSGTAGLSILEVTVQESQPFSANLSFDNYSPISLGSERMGVSLGYKNPTGWGDDISATYYRSTTGGLNLADFTYRIPLNPMEGTLILQAIPTWTRVTQAPFDQFDITGTNPAYEISYRQPLVRNLQEEFAISVGFRYQDGETLGLGRPDLFGNSRTSVIKLDQDYVHRDPDGLWFFQSQFNFGTGLFNATQQSDASLPDGSFFSWLGQGQRLQRLDENQLLIVQGSLQLTPDSLLPDYLFIIGGGQSVRGYVQNARSGDNGFRFSVEDRISLVRNEEDVSIFEVAPFMDMGSVWNSAGNPNQLPPKTFLISAGLGLIWNNAFSLSGLNLRFDYGLPIIDLQSPVNNLQNDGIYFQVNYQPFINK